MPTTIEKLRMLLDQLVGRNPQDPDRFILKDEGVLERMTRRYPYNPNLEKITGTQKAISAGDSDNPIDGVLYAAKDFYIIGILYYAFGSTAFNQIHTEAIWIRPVDATDTEYFPWKMDKTAPYKAGTNYYLYGTLLYPIPLPVPKGNTFQISVLNYTAADFNANVYLLGFAEA